MDTFPASLDRPELTPRYEGKRFEDHAIPVELLGDMAAYRDLLQDLARHLYLEANPQRKRVPRGFDEAFKLSLKNIGEGSAVAMLVNYTEGEQSERFGEFVEFFYRAKSLINETIAGFTEGSGVVPKAFPLSFLPSFGRIGRYLKPDERINFGTEAKPVVYTNAIRQTMVLWGADEVETSVDTAGNVISLFSEPEKHCELRLDDGSLVVAPYPPAFAETVMKAYGNVNLFVTLVGTAMIDRHRHIKRVLRWKSAELLDAVDMALRTAIKRLEEMKRLPVGWCDGAGQPLSAEAVEAACEFIRGLVEDHEIQTPSVFPTVEGRVQLEWPTSGGRTVEGVLDLDTRKFEVVCIGADDTDFEETLDVSDAAGITGAAAWLRKSLNAQS